MKRQRVLLLVAVLLLIILSILSQADTDSGISCFTNLDCELLNEPGKEYYCHPDTMTCFRLELVEPVLEESVEPAANVSGEVQPADQKIANIEAALSGLKADLANTKANILTTTTNIIAIQSQLDALKSDLEGLKSEVTQDIAVVDSQANSLATGLAALQEDVDSTQTTLSSIEETVNKSKTFTDALTIAGFILLAFLIAGTITYFVTRGKKQKTAAVQPQIVDYITKHIKEGQKYPKIKEKLKQAGWSDEDIHWAYKETIKHNYYKFKESSAGKAQASSRPSFQAPSGRRTAPDRKKLLGIAVFTLLLIGGFLFLLRGITTGKAIEFQKLVGGMEGGAAGEVSYQTICTPPHILTPDGDSCCLDENNNSICDQSEARLIEVPQAGSCTDNAHCAQGEYCINSACQSLSSLYKGTGDCSKLCHYYSVDVKLIYPQGTQKRRQVECESNSDCNDDIAETQDSCLSKEVKYGKESYCIHKPLVEDYRLKPRQGSYTAMGALEWKILDMPQYCKGEQPIVPIKLSYKKTGEIIREDVITLKLGESKVLTHPEYSDPLGTLVVSKIFELCPE